MKTTRKNAETDRIYSDKKKKSQNMWVSLPTYLSFLPLPLTITALTLF